MKQFSEMTKNEKRAFLLAASNCAVNLDNESSLQGCYEVWMQGLGESCWGGCGNCGSADSIFDMMIDAEMQSFLDTLNEDGISDGDPLPSYWADVDAWLEVNDGS